jgi:hypothetical protein
MNGQLRIRVNRPRQVFDLKCAMFRAYVVAIIAIISLPRTSRSVRSMRAAALKSGIRTLFCVPVFTELSDFTGLFGENAQHTASRFFIWTPVLWDFVSKTVFSQRELMSCRLQLHSNDN